MLLITLAVFPAAFLMFLVFRQDKTEREPAGLVLLTMLFGMLTVIPVLVFELLGQAILTIVMEESVFSLFMEFFFVVAVSEEFWKFLAVRLFIWKRPAFNYRFDGIVYCVASSLGFALLENIMYVLQNGFAVGFMRAVTSVPGHCVFGVFMGMFFGNAKLYEVRGNKSASIRNQIWSLVVPILLHGFYDFSISVGSVIMVIAFLVFIVVCDILAIIFVIRHQKQDIPFHVMDENQLWCINPMFLRTSDDMLTFDLHIPQQSNYFSYVNNERRPNNENQPNNQQFTGNGPL